MKERLFLSSINKPITVADVRIGNWVRDPGNGFNIKVSSIISSELEVDKQISCIVPQSDNDIWSYKEGELQPILLTPKILLDCGFEIHCSLKAEGDSVRKKLKKHGIYFWFKDDTFEKCEIGSHQRRILFVHVLQNIVFFLTHTELEITLSQPQQNIPIL